MRLLLREDQLPIHHHFELSSGALDQRGIDATGFLDLCRQTGGSRKIVSLDAVGDLDGAH